MDAEESIPAPAEKKKSWKILVEKALADEKTELDIKRRRGIDDVIDDAAATELAPILKTMTGLKVLKLRGKCVIGSHPSSSSPHLKGVHERMHTYPYSWHIHPPAAAPHTHTYTHSPHSDTASLTPLRHSTSLTSL